MRDVSIFFYFTTHFFHRRSITIEEMEKREDSVEQESDDFLAMITQYQAAIRGYIRGSIGSYHDSDDVMQKTNIVLCKKEDQWNRDVPFLQWAFSVAKYEVLAFYRDKAREKVVFNDEVLELVMQDSAELAPELSDRNLALRQCLGQLSDEHKLLLSSKYSARLSIDAIASKMNRSSNGVRSLLKRVRAQLRECVTHKTAIQ